VYAWIWNRLPGSTAARAALSLLLALGVVVLLFLVAFPWAEESLPFLQVTVGG
jgi:hypothetical protein